MAKKKERRAAGIPVGDDVHWFEVLTCCNDADVYSDDISSGVVVSETRLQELCCVAHSTLDAWCHSVL